jgi:hypothetical protein
MPAAGGGTPKELALLPDLRRVEAFDSEGLGLMT